MTFLSPMGIILGKIVEMENPSMNRFMKRIFPILLATLIVVSTGWYLFEYDPDFTRDILLQQARIMEENGNRNASVWLYNLAYERFGSNDEIAIELAYKFIEVGNYSKAEYTLRKAIADGGNVELYMALSQTYVKQGKLRDAVLMLENVSGEMKEKLEQLRPSAPQASVPSGSYRQYLSIELTSPGNTIYVATDNDYPSSLTDPYTGAISVTSGETTLFAVSVGENGLVSPLSVFNYIVYDVVEVVTFQDAGFEAALRKQLGYNKDRVIYSNTLWTVTELTLDESVTSCSDLKWLPNLNKLTVNGAVLDDAEVLSNCTHIQYLTVTGSIVSTEMMRAIGSLSNLQELRLNECGISSIAPLSKLSRLQHLDLSSNAIRDITALAGLTGLRYLNLSSNALINLDCFENLTALITLDVSYNSIVSTAPLAPLTSLEELNVSSNALRSLEGIGNLTQLTKLYAAHNELLDLDVLTNCQMLTHLDVSYNTLLNVDTVANLTALQVLDFSHNEVTLLPSFQVDCALQVINGNHNRLSSLKKLSGLRNLTHIYMDYNTEISSVTALTSCASLKEVYVYGTKVRTVSALTKLGILVIYSPV